MGFRLAVGSTAQSIENFSPLEKHVACAIRGDLYELLLGQSASILDDDTTPFVMAVCHDLHNVGDRNLIYIYSKAPAIRGNLD
jgi:hypothetical protein